MNTKHLILITGNATLVGPAIEVVAKKVVEAGPGKCPFETRHEFTTERLSGIRYCNICLISYLLGLPSACFIVIIK